ncbi:hypothetical protein [Litoreibacter roseus]|uniref:Uncharacterized protein n=1 Tax=Litoreibacter roseus TaxID=2601869 RepID=A0A6N6JKS7_9RHOB|nr:hypothetical protein [Litoreibacter roseus]GFE66916.1 hypothetical protein KIN_39900 [Litoreibacter roseus]
MVLTSKPKAEFLKDRLVLQRQFAVSNTLDHPDEDALQRFQAEGVQGWIDTANHVEHDHGVTTARRAITDDGQLIWAVAHPEQRFAYSSAAVDPNDAMEEARSAWFARRQIGVRWKDVAVLRLDVLLNGAHFSVTREDAYGAGLCRVGVDKRLRQAGFAQVFAFSARKVAALSLIETQLAYVLFAAHLRHIKRTHKLVRHQDPFPASSAIAGI